jgi:hypothetical protein
MAFVPGHKWDVFISYAHKDRPSVGPTANWIFQFKEQLEVALNQASGEDFEIYFDETGQQLNAEIDDIPNDVAESAVLLLIGSNNYVKSSWCCKEVKTFRDKFDDTGRIFIAELMKLREDLQYPAEVPNNLRAKFWFDNERQTRMTVIPRMGRFNELIAKLAQQMWAQLDQMKKQAIGEVDAPDAAAAGGQAPTVFLAFADDDVSRERARVKDYLESEGIRVLPDILYPPSDPRRYRDLLLRGLEEADLFVQVLGSAQGKPANGVPDGYAIDQHEAAKTRGIQIRQWRPRWVRTADMPEGPWLDLLAGKTVETGSLPQFNQRVLRAARPPEVPDVPRGILINADNADSELALDLIDVCGRKNKFADLAEQSSDNDALRAQYANASLVTLLYGKAQHQWVKSQVDIFKRAWAQAGKGRKPPLLIYLAPPEDKGPEGPRPGTARLPFALPDLHIIDKRQQWSADPFGPAIDKLSPGE